MSHLSEIDRIIRTLSASSEILEPTVYEDVCQFIRQLQLESGAFADRGG
ncbi:MAG: hypothetical protein PHY99_08545 [Bacteroidales bacterium]|nr:hypothetical protein [Bacteroidales bacterium]